MAILKLPVRKAGKGVFVEIDSDDINDLPANSLQLVLIDGLDKIVNSRGSKLKAPSKLSGTEFDENKAAAVAQAEKNLADLKAGTLVKKSAGTGDTKVSREVMTEARRLAKIRARDAIKANGEKISDYASSTITAMANYLVENDDQYIEQATINVAATKASAVGKTEGVASVFAKLGLKADPKKVAEREAKAAEKKTQLSAKQAGKVAPRKGQQPSQKPPMSAKQAEQVRHTAH